MVRNADVRAPDAGRIGRILQSGHHGDRHEHPSGEQQGQPGGIAAEPAPDQHRTQHGVGDREQHTHDEAERDDSDCRPDVLLNRSGEQLGPVNATGTEELSLGVLASGLVVDGACDERFDDHPAEREADTAGHQAGQQVPSRRGEFGHHRHVQWHGKPSRWRASCKNSWTCMSEPNTETAPWSIPTK